MTAGLLGVRACDGVKECLKAEKSKIRNPGSTYLMLATIGLASLAASESGYLAIKSLSTFLATAFLPDSRLALPSVSIAGGTR